MIDFEHATDELIATIKRLRAVTENCNESECENCIFSSEDWGEMCLFRNVEVSLHRISKQIANKCRTAALLVRNMKETEDMGDLDIDDRILEMSEKMEKFFHYVVYDDEGSGKYDGEDVTDD